MNSISVLLSEEPDIDHPMKVWWGIRSAVANQWLVVIDEVLNELDEE